MAAHELVSRWSKVIGVDTPVTASAVIALANEPKSIGSHGDKEYRFPQFRTLLIEWAGASKGDQIDPIRLGRWLQGINARVYGNMRIDIVRRQGRANEYVLVKVR